MKPTKDLVRYSCLVGLFLAACMVLVQISVAQAEQAEQPDTQKQSEESAKVNSEQIREEIQKALEQVDVDSIVRQALEQVRESLEQAKIQVKVQESIHSVDLDRIVKDALREAEKAKKELEEDKSEPL